MTALVLVVVVVVFTAARMLMGRHKRQDAALKADLSAVSPSQPWHARTYRDGGRFWRHEGF